MGWTERVCFQKTSCSMHWRCVKSQTSASRPIGHLSSSNLSHCNRTVDWTSPKAWGKLWGHPLAASVSTAKGTLWRAQRACFRFLPCAARCLTPWSSFSVSILIVDQDAPVTHQDQGCFAPSACFAPGELSRPRKPPVPACLQATHSQICGCPCPCGHQPFSG